MAAFIRFRSTCFSEDLKVDALFVKQSNYFFSQYFYFKNRPKKYVLSFTLPWGEGIPSLLFIMFSSLLFAPTLFKNFSLLAKSKDFDFFKATLSTLNITYIKPIYIKSSFGFHSNNGTTVLKLKTLSRSLLKNLILQNCLHRLNIWGCRYYTKIRDIIVSFCIFSLLMYDWIFGKNLEHDTYGLKWSPWPSTLRGVCSMLGPWNLC